ncbi:unnamed protein product [Prorocentrum cordatum]|uniref:Cytochrome b5 heme-binding domain-containing protein n=1 Tax=Prorocentrum cordatum TaxID=2364126 RepID=A0ABN9PGH1_9DINO|nr:unnamed protein product [Polarella glacialis]
MRSPWPALEALALTEAAALAEVRLASPVGEAPVDLHAVEPSALEEHLGRHIDERFSLERERAELGALASLNGAILPSEALFFRGLVDLVGASTVVESGVNQGGSTRAACLWARAAPGRRVIALERVPPSPLVVGELRRACGGVLDFRIGDAFSLLDGILQGATAPGRAASASACAVALFLDGPKGRVAVRLAEAALDRFPGVCVAAVHDVPRLDPRYRDADGRHLTRVAMESSRYASVFSDAAWFVQRFARGLDAGPWAPPRSSEEATGSYGYVLGAFVRGWGRAGPRGNGSASGRESEHAGRRKPHVAAAAATARARQRGLGRGRAAAAAAAARATMRGRPPPRRAACGAARTLLPLLGAGRAGAAAAAGAASAGAASAEATWATEWTFFASPARADVWRLRRARPQPAQRAAAAGANQSGGGAAAAAAREVLRHLRPGGGNASASGAEPDGALLPLGSCRWIAHVSAGTYVNAARLAQRLQCLEALRPEYYALAPGTNEQRITLADESGGYILGSGLLRQLGPSWPAECRERLPRTGHNLEPGRDRLPGFFVVLCLWSMRGLMLQRLGDPEEALVRHVSDVVTAAPAVRLRAQMPAAHCTLLVSCESAQSLSQVHRIMTDPANTAMVGCSTPSLLEPDALAPPWSRRVARELLRCPLLRALRRVQPLATGSAELRLPCTTTCVVMSPGPKPCGAAREPRRAAAGTSAPGSWHGARGVAAPLAAALLLPSAVLLLAGCGDAGTTAVDTMYPNTEQGPDYCMSCAEARGSEKDAQFLIQATFGPTRSSLQELGQTTPQAWVKEQLALPAGSHREYYRKRVSSRLTESPLVGSPRSRCSAGSRWHSFAFSIADKGKRINVTGNKIHVDGALRSDVDPAYTGNGIPAPNNCTDEPSNWMSNNGRTCSSVNSRFNCGSADADSAWIRDKICQQSCFDVGNGYSGDDCSPGWANQEDSGFICTVEENLGGVVTLGTTESCEAYRAYKNPAIWFSSSAVESIESLSFQEVRPGVVVLAESYGQDPCDLGRFVYHDGQYYLSDPRLELLQNDLASPSGGGLNTRCRAVTRTFLNEGSCQLRTACGAVEVEGSRPPASFALNATTFQFFLGSAERYVYAVTGLTDAETPCGRRSRWRLLDCGSEDCTATALSATEADATAAALALEEGHLRDVYVHCESAGAVPAGAVVVSGSGYFLHVHSNEYNVYDFTDWVNAHPGGTEQIMRWASGDFQLEFPASHAMSRWVSAQSSLHYIGRLGDTVDFEVLPVGLQAAWTVGYESCGSPGEVANDPSLGHHFSLYTDFNAGYTDTNYEVPFWGVQSKLSRTTVWTMLALDADDQLRQRAAWALSQILVTSINGVSSSSNHAEGWLVYYDIFVRNAFGNYRDILREVTYSPIMGEYLSYRNSRSLDSDSSYPDENYAREIMQLFTIGLWELNLDGTRKTDASGNHVPTYTNEHIMSLARVFTGFREQAARPNIENTGTRNMVDPMQMVGDWHDVYPKPDLSGGYLGDGYPLCSDLPPQAFLLEGARYEFRGYTYAGTDVLVLSSSSALYAALEQIQLTVELSSTIDCTGEKECVADSLHVVQVGEGYYEYVPPTCVHLYFYNGQVVSPGSANDFGKEWKEICMDPNWMGAGTACCKGCSNVGTSGMANQNRTCENMAETWPWVVKTGCPQVSDWWVENKFCQLACWELGMGYAGDDCSDGPLQSERVCGYYQEKVRFEAASARCESLGMHVCEQGTDGGECGHDDINVWTPRNCTVSLEVREDGRVASQWDSKTMQNPFPVTWADGFPTTGNCPSQCAQSSSGCTCPISVVAKAVFDAVPSRAELLGEGARLRIGAFPPSVSAFCLAPCDGEVKAYASDDIGHVDESTVFECGGVYYKNMESAVDVAGYTFRNPPVFMLAKELTGRSVRADEALAEVEALLDHLVNHPNVPPFVSHRLIQRFVTSNPTPDYVSAVAQAFSTGEFNGETYSGEYGDLGATFAAILLHPQARGGFLDSSVGKLREPIIKILHFLRSMEYVDLRDREIVMRSLDDDIGQWPYASPSVFNYLVWSTGQLVSTPVWLRQSSRYSRRRLRSPGSTA